MVTINVKNIDGQTILPAPGNQHASGYDIVATSDPKIVGEVDSVKSVDGKDVTFYRRIDWVEYNTGLKIAPLPSESNKTFHSLILPRSSVRKYDLVLANSIGLIDNDYRGEILFCFKYIWQPESLRFENNRLVGIINFEKMYKKGDKLGQLLVDERNKVQFKLVSDLEQTERAEGGFGSTDAKKKEVPQVSTADGALKAFSTIVENIPGGSLTDRYQKGGGIPIKKRYSEEMKERQQ